MEKMARPLEADWAGFIDEDASVGMRLGKSVKPLRGGERSAEKK